MHRQDVDISEPARRKKRKHSRQAPGGPTCKAAVVHRCRSKAQPRGASHAEAHPHASWLRQAQPSMGQLWPGRRQRRAACRRGAWVPVRKVLVPGIPRLNVAEQHARAVVLKESSWDEGQYIMPRFGWWTCGWGAQDACLS